MLNDGILMTHGLCFIIPKEFVVASPGQVQRFTIFATWLLLLGHRIASLVLLLRVSLDGWAWRAHIWIMPLKVSEPTAPQTPLHERQGSSANVLPTTNTQPLMLRYLMYSRPGMPLCCDPIESSYTTTNLAISKTITTQITLTNDLCFITSDIFSLHYFHRKDLYPKQPVFFFHCSCRTEAAFQCFKWTSRTEAIFFWKEWSSMIKGDTRQEQGQPAPKRWFEPLLEKIWVKLGIFPGSYGWK